MKAFPTDRLGVIKDSRGISINEAQQDGMDLRDYFAAKAVPFLLKYITTDSVLMNEDFVAVAKDSYKLADAMMEARK